MSNATKTLSRFGQSLWLDKITRDLLDSGTLKHYIDELFITGLTSNPTIFDHAISQSSSYDTEIQLQLAQGKSCEDLFFNLAVQDLTRAADLFAPVFERTNSVDGFVSLEVSPLLAYDAQASLAQARKLHAQANRPNLFIKIPGTKEAFQRLKKRSSSACRSMSHSCSLPPYQRPCCAQYDQHYADGNSGRLCRSRQAFGGTSN